MSQPSAISSLQIWIKAEVAQLCPCPTLCNSMGCRLPGSSVHGILQARILEWVAILFSRGSSQPRIEPRSPTLQVGSLPAEPPGQPRAPKTEIQQMLPLTQRWLLRSWGNTRSNHLPLLKVDKETPLVSCFLSWGVYESNEFNEPRGLHLPIHRMLNSLTWYLIFEVQIACFLCGKLVYRLTSPPASWEQFSFSELLRCCLLGSEF